MNCARCNYKTNETANGLCGDCTLHAHAEGYVHRDGRWVRTWQWRRVECWRCDAGIYKWPTGSGTCYGCGGTGQRWTKVHECSGCRTLCWEGETPCHPPVVEPLTTAVTPAEPSPKGRQRDARGRFVAAS